MQIGIIGGGRVGRCLGAYLREKGMLKGITGSTSQHCQELAELFGVETTNNIKLIAETDLVLLTVPDRLVEQIATELAAKLGKEVKGKTFLHVSGSLSLLPLKPLADQGAKVGSLHPLQSFSVDGTTELKGVYMALDGDDEVQTQAKALVELLGGKPFYVPAEERAAYHAAACICSNYAVTVETLAQKLMARWTGDNQSAWQALKPLFKGTADNLLRTTEAGKVLTGPIGRGDGNTLVKHLEVLPEQLIPLYCALGRETVAIALENGNIDKETAKQLSEILKQDN